MTKNQRRRMKKKALKHAKRMGVHETADESKSSNKNPESNGLEVEIEYVSQDLSAQFESDPSLKEFSKVFEKFSSAEELCQERETQDEVGGERDWDDNIIDHGLLRRKRKHPHCQME